MSYRNLHTRLVRLEQRIATAGSIVLTMPDGGTITLPANDASIARLAMRAFRRAPNRGPGVDTPQPPPEPRLDEAINLILQAEHVRWPDPEAEHVTALLRDLLDATG